MENLFDLDEEAEQNQHLYEIKDYTQQENDTNKNLENNTESYFNLDQDSNNDNNFSIKIKENNFDINDQALLASNNDSSNIKDQDFNSFNNLVKGVSNVDLRKGISNNHLIEISETESNNQSTNFEFKIKTTDNFISSDQDKKQKEYAVTDNVDIKEFDKIDHVITFPFELDVFQKRSIIRLERHENVLVCAHTSSGKTVIAEYAIAMGKKHEKRVFYTSPIKALSNQKYREFKEKFGDVGILTGDVSQNPDAQTLIMTTEILQSSLYKNSNLLNHCEWIVFDEVHYINDNERGHVWEEILILLPPKIGIIMLSATIPNYEDFAKWVGRIKNTIIYMQITNKRVVPLEHKIYLTNKDIYVCKDNKDMVHKDNIDKAIRKLEDLNKANMAKQSGGSNYNKNFNNKTISKNSYGAKPNMSMGRANQQKATSNKILELATYIKNNNLSPAVIFVFSIKKIDEYSNDLAQRILDYDWISKEESSRIIKFFNRCVGVLSKEDQQIPQITKVKEILKLGIGIHHAGLLPILKETIEILYSKGLIKVLFATTSFSIGLNMPTRTVIFTEITKFNDQVKEILSSSEYLQMCGRAGRRGVDDKGHIFLLLGDKTNPPKADDIALMMKDGGTEVESKFRLSYKTIISILSRDVREINQFFKESYLENKKMEKMPESFIEKNKLEEAIRNLGSLNCIYGDYDNDTKHIDIYNLALNNYEKKKTELWKCKELKDALKEGRLVRVKSSLLNNKTIIAVIIRYYYPPSFAEEYRVFYAESKITNNKLQIDYESELVTKTDLGDKIGYYVQVFPSEIEDLLDAKFKLTKEMLTTDSDSFTFLSNKKYEDQYAKELIELNTNQNKVPKVVDYLKYSKDIKVFQIVKEKQASEQTISTSKCHNCIHKENHMKFYAELEPLQIKFKKLKNDLNTEDLKHTSEFNRRVKVLQKLNYVNSDLGLEIKGKAARELSTTDCILMTETLLGGILDGLSVKEKIAFMSGFAFSKNEIEKEDPKISKNFSISVGKFSKLLEQIVELEMKFDVTESKYNRRSTFTMAESILSWLEGESFINVVRKTQLEEGKLFTLMMRIFQLCDEVKNFFTVLNLDDNAKSFEEAKTILMRDILSCKSLYLQDIDFNV